MARHRRNVRLSLDEVVGALRAFHTETGTIPTELTWTATRRHPSVWTIQSCCGSWRAALALAFGARAPAGRGRPPVWTRETAIRALRRFPMTTGRMPTVAAWTAAGGQPAAATLVRLFGSWRGALRAAFGPAASLPAPGRPRLWSRADALAALVHAYRIHGGRLTQRTWRRVGYHPSPASCVAFFGTWASAWAEAERVLADTPSYADPVAAP